MRGLTPERAQRIKALVEDGRVRIGSTTHLELVDFEMAVGDLSGRSQKIIRLSMRGWSPQLIADSLYITKSHVIRVVKDFAASLEADDVLGGLGKRA